MWIDRGAGGMWGKIRKPLLLARETRETRESRLPTSQPSALDVSGSAGGALPTPLPLGNPLQLYLDGSHLD
jgi:hypothetical protein